jgi:hypothetical protein
MAQLQIVVEYEFLKVAKDFERGIIYPKAAFVYGEIGGGERFLDTTEVPLLLLSHPEGRKTQELGEKP